MEFKLPQREEISNKSTYGKVLNIAGSDYMAGAAYLSSVSALKIGCGYCFLLTTDEARRAVASQTQNVVFLPANEIKKYAKEVDVISIGCGLSQNNYANRIFNKFIQYTPVETPVIVDADGLNIVSKNPDKFINKNFKNIIFTPHPKEASRLLNVDDVTKDMEFAAREITRIYGCVTVLKTHRTFVCAPDGRTYTNKTGNNSMAKAGSGDVLTGMIAGIAAQGAELFEAACLGVHLHGLSGDISAQILSQYCVMAKDLIDNIPVAVKKYLS